MFASPAAAPVATAAVPLPAMTVTPLPAAEVVVDARRPSAVSVAELMDAELEDDSDMLRLNCWEACALALADPEPAITVTAFAAALVVVWAAEVEECMAALDELPCAVALFPPATIVTAAATLDEPPCAVALLPPATTVTAAAALAEADEEVELDPARTVTALPTAVVVVPATSPSGVKVPFEAEDEDEEVVAAAAVAFFPPSPPAITVTAPAAVVEAAAAAASLVVFATAELPRVVEEPVIATIPGGNDELLVALA